MKSLPWESSGEKAFDGIAMIRLFGSLNFDVGRQL